jgi:hypothetical protein
MRPDAPYQPRSPPVLLVRGRFVVRTRFGGLDLAGSAEDRSPGAESVRIIQVGKKGHGSHGHHGKYKHYNKHYNYKHYNYKRSRYYHGGRYW